MKLLEDALIKVTAVASKTGSKPVRDMAEALIAGERDPQVLAGLARGKMRARHDRLAGALTGRFDDHHGELARVLLDQAGALTAHIVTITGRAGELIAAMPGAGAWTLMVSPGRPRAWAPARRRCPRSPAWTRSPASASRPPG